MSYTITMLKKLLFLLSITFLMIFFLSILKIEKIETNIIKTNNLIKTTIPIKIVKEEPIGKLIIPNISLNQDLYALDSEENTIEKHISILKESYYPNIVYLAAHSGEGDIAYFNDLILLNENNSIILNYYGETKEYIVKDIVKVDKTGYIGIPKYNENTLILTTCDQNDLSKQIIVRCIEKES